MLFIYLFGDAENNSDYIASNDWVILGNKLEMWKEAVLCIPAVRTWHFQIQVSDITALASLLGH
jgi:hypothetical protein